MSPGDRRFFSAETEAQAVLDAAGALGVPPAELAYRRLEKKQGFLRRPRVVIEVDTGAPRRQPQAPPAGAPPPAVGREPGPARPAPRAMPAAPPAARSREHAEPRDLTPAAAIEPFAEARGADGAARAAGAVAALAGIECRAAVRAAAGEEGEELRVELTGHDAAVLREDDGELLRTVEYLLRRMVRDLPPGGLVADSDGYRAAQTDALRRRALAAAEEVLRSGEAFLFEGLPAADRRVVHLAVQGVAGVSSASEGEGDLRRVRISRAAAG